MAAQSFRSSSATREITCGIQNKRVRYYVNSTHQTLSSARVRQTPHFSNIYINIIFRSTTRISSGRFPLLFQETSLRISYLALLFTSFSLGTNVIFIRPIVFSKHHKDSSLRVRGNVFVFKNESNKNHNLQVHRSCFKIVIFQVRSDIEMQMALFIY